MNRFEHHRGPPGATIAIASKWLRRIHNTSLRGKPSLVQRGTIPIQTSPLFSAIPTGLKTHVAELDTLMAHLRSRTAGPKCLTCFSEHIQVLPDEGIVLLPDGKHYTIANCGLGDSTYQIELELDVNGNEIRRTKR